MASINVADSIVEALAAGKPVVALESTIFTHGLPRPRNYEVAIQGEEAIRALGAIPATIGVYKGVPTVGLSPEQIKELSEDDDVFKASIRDLALGAVSKKNGGTTIAATTFLAYKTGIKVFATGGLGGVHHGASENFDESADLVALAKYPIVLVSSGAKAVLDIHATLERFETLSVPVVGYQTNNYPGFYVTDSGFKLGNRVDSPEEVATIYNVMRDMGLSEAICVGNPVPEDEQLDPKGLDVVIEKAWQALEDQKVEGQAVTPFLLEFIRQETKDASLDANVALYFNNARLAAKIATALVS
ncbi:pseudouridine-5'-phosphate glycosidase [Trueperella sp.]|uniref:pseudouridine-5'-phosphate glycosidase n=1 Tax=Trueperella sp. TaxID=2699835 RepID=UPI0022EB0A3A|nr:pseudouridine-5'-phosphate glycosidase [Trueperella sp.]